MWKHAHIIYDANAMRLNVKIILDKIVKIVMILKYSLDATRYYKYCTTNIKSNIAVNILVINNSCT